MSTSRFQAAWKTSAGCADYGEKCNSKNHAQNFFISHEQLYLSTAPSHVQWKLGRKCPRLQRTLILRFIMSASSSKHLQCRSKLCALRMKALMCLPSPHPPEIYNALHLASVPTICSRFTIRLSASCSACNYRNIQLLCESSEIYVAYHSGLGNITLEVQNWSSPWQESSRR